MRPSKNLVFALITIGLWEEVRVLVVKKKSHERAPTLEISSSKSETIQLCSKTEPQIFTMFELEN